MVAAAHGLCALVFGALYAFGAMFEAMQLRFAADRFAVASVFSAGAVVVYLTGPLAGALADRWPVRRVVGAGVTLLAVGFALAGEAATLHALAWAHAACIGVGVGLVYVPTVAVVQRWFVRRRSLASGLALAGTGLGTFAGPLLAGALMRALDWPMALRTMALGIALLGLVAAAWLVGSPGELGQWPDGDGAPEPSSPSPQSTGWLLAQALSSRRFWCFFAAIGLASVSLFVCMVHLVPLARGLGVPAARADLLLGLVGLGNIGGRLGLSRLGDRLGSTRMLLVLNVALVVLHCLWGSASGFGMLAVFAVLFGAAHGGCIALYPAQAAQWFGTRRLGAILGSLYVSVGLAASGGASLAGLLYDRLGSYAVPLLASGIMAALACIFLAWASRPCHPATLSTS